jgi:hypothetical protein
LLLPGGRCISLFITYFPSGATMSKGLEYQQRIQEALAAFEDAIVRRENKKALESRVPLQQEADRARARVMDVIAKVVTEERLAK